jgi:hypothetical protein
MSNEPTLAEVGDFLRDLRSVSDRMMRFEDIPQDELDALDTRKRALIEGIEPGFYCEEAEQ